MYITTDRLVEQSVPGRAHGANLRPVSVCGEAVSGIVTTTAATTSWASLFIASSPFRLAPWRSSQ